LNAICSKDFALVIPARFGIWFTLGMLPLGILVFWSVRPSTARNTISLRRWRCSRRLQCSVCSALFAYRKSLTYCWAGSAILARLLAFVMPFVHLFDLFARPEMWPFVSRSRPTSITSGFIPLMIFVAGSLLVTGRAMLFLYFVWPERKLPTDAPHAVVLKTSA